MTRDIMRQWQGRANRAQGALFEQLVQRGLDYYKVRGVAVIDKTPEPMKVLRSQPGGKFVACFAGKGQPDYKGCLAPVGREVIFDAKFTTGDYIAQSRITQEQATALETHCIAGALCYVLVGFAVNGELPRMYRVEWRCWQEMADRLGRRHIKLSDLEGDGRTFDDIEERLGVRYIPMVGGVPMVLDGVV